MCTNISLESTHPENCTDFEQREKCVIHLNENMTQAGNYTITVVIKNDVSVQSLSVKVTVKQPGKKLNSRADFKL